MKNFDFKPLMPHVIAVVIFVAISFIYMSPVFQGKAIQQQDIIKFEGMSKEIADYREATGEEALWTNAMFSGMPAFQISVVYSMNIANKIFHFLNKLMPFADFLFIYLLGFYILLIALRVNPWLSIVGAFAFAFSSYHLIIITAGHTSKAYAIGYMAPTLAGIILTFRGKLLAGGALTAFFLTMQIAANHLQITYYFLFIVFFWVLGEFIFKILEKEHKSLLKISAALAVAVLIAVGVNFGNIWSTYVYSKQTMRGPSELTIGINDNGKLGKIEQTTGLDKEYITRWSYGVAETFSLMIPNIKGGGDNYLGNNKNAMENVDRNYYKQIANNNQYWGDQPGTSGPVYVGAIVMFLLMLSLFYEKNKMKWLLLTTIILSIMLAWGKNFNFFTNFFLDHFPMYNKFRAVSMILIIAEFCIPLLAFIGLKNIIENPDNVKKNMKFFYISLGLTAGLAFLFLALPELFFSFLNKQEALGLEEQMITYPESAAFIQEYIQNLQIARISIFRADTLRSLIFILLAATAFYFFITKKVKTNLFIVILGVLILADMWFIAKRYLNNDNFKSTKQISKSFEKSEADKIILEDTDPNFRVFKFGNPFNDSYTSYHHKSIGGYHGAKLQRYQDLISLKLQTEISRLQMILQDTILDGITKINYFESELSKANALNMLNTKYLIYSPNAAPIENEYRLGNAWFVNDIKMVENADDEIMALGDFEPVKTAIIDKRYQNHLEGFQIKPDSLAQISLKEYKPNKLTYTSKSNTPQLAVFSEVYYEPDWFVTINGKQLEHFRVNYVLRGMIVPEGENTIVFEFRPKSYYAGEKVSMASSLLLIVLVVLAVYAYIKSNSKTPVKEVIKGIKEKKKNIS